MKRKAFGTHYIARICQVTPPAVIRWLEDGKISSFTTGGGHRRVWDLDLIAFLKEHNMPIPADLAASAKQKILVVDDEPENRRLINRVIAHHFPEVEVHEAVNGFEAGHKVSALLPTLVVLDLQLPGVNVLDVCRMIRGDERLRKIKILVITGQDVEESRIRALEAGADDFLGKPFPVDELAAGIGRLMK